MWIICFQPQKGKYRVSLQKECHDLAVGKMHVRRSTSQLCTMGSNKLWSCRILISEFLIYSEKATWFEKKIYLGFDDTNLLSPIAKEVGINKQGVQKFLNYKTSWIRTEEFLRGGGQNLEKQKTRLLVY